MVYTGPFIIENDKFTTKVDISWNELLTGQDQVRFFKLMPRSLLGPNGPGPATAVPNDANRRPTTAER